MENQKEHTELELERIKNDLERKLIHLENSKYTTNIENKKRFKLNYLIYGLIGALFFVIMYQSIHFLNENSNSKLKTESQIITDHKNKFYTDSLKLIDTNYELLEIQNQIVLDSIENEELFLEEEILEKDRIRNHLKSHSKSRLKSKRKKKKTYPNSNYDYNSNNNNNNNTVKFNTDTSFDDKLNVKETTNPILVNTNTEDSRSGIPRYNVDEFPIYPGCESKKSQSKIKKCFKSKVSKYVSKRLNNQIPKSLAKEIGLDKINISIVITKRGTIKVLSIDGSKNDILKKETFKVIKSLPKLKPGKNRGQVVVVRYNIPVNF